MFDKTYGLYIAHGPNGPISMNGRMVNRHGLIAGATGTGKTVTLQVMAETLSQAGVPCFMADIKGDLSGIAENGNLNDFIAKRCDEFGIPVPGFKSCPVRFFDVFGEQGHPIRATISGMGADLLARLLELNPTQTGVLNIVFRIAADENMPLIDLKDIKLMLDYVSKNAGKYTTAYGNISSPSVGAIQRALLSLENQGAAGFFGEPSFDIRDFIATKDGMGMLNVLAADRLVQSPKVYSTFLMWLLNEIYAALPEVGDLELPKLVFFFDEAHLLFNDAPKTLMDNIERVVRLIRSKGVGIYFVTQNPIDVPDTVLGQLGNRVQHALRAFTPRDQKAVKAAAQTFRPNPGFDTGDMIQQLGTGEALVSFLDEKGAPAIVENAKIMFPLSRIGAISPEKRMGIIRKSSIFGKYDKPVDRNSAFEMIMSQRREAEKQAGKTPAGPTKTSKSSSSGSRSGKSKSSKKGGFWSAVASIATPILKSIGRSIGREVVRNVTGSTTRRRKK